MKVASVTRDRYAYSEKEKKKNDSRLFLLFDVLIHT